MGRNGIGTECLYGFGRTVEERAQIRDAAMRRDGISERGCVAPRMIAKVA